MEHRATGYTRGFIWIMELAGWGLFVCLIVSNWMIFVLIDGFFEGDIEGVRDERQQR